MNFKILLLLVFSTLIFTNTHAQNQEQYAWTPVRIGGGGYITGMKIHPQNSNVAYYRTDVGGVYGWDNEKKELVQLLNFAADKENYYGVAGIALHPTLENIVYLAVDRGNTTETSKILYSVDYGENWAEIDVANGIKFGANGGREGGTGINDRDREGSPITINPQNTNELWVGTRENGLWVLDLTKPQPWRKINDIPDNTQEASIRTVVFHPENPSIIFVGYWQFGIYRSLDGGNSFELINNGFSDLENVADLSFSKNGSKIYAAVRNQGIYKLYDPENSKAWTKLDIPFANQGKGYQTVTASPHDDLLVIASPAATFGNNLAQLQVSKDAGKTWSTKSNVSISNTFKWVSISDAGAYTSQIAFDPEDSNKLSVTCWFGLWHTDNWDANTVNWANDRAKGHEEIVTTGLRAFPDNSKNNNILVNSADSPGILIKDPNSYENSDLRELIDDGSLVVKGQDIAICEAYPNNFAITATNLWSPEVNNPSYGSLFYTNNGGESYIRALGYDRDWGKSLVGTSVKDPANIVVVHGNQIHYSKDRGATFSAAEHPELSTVVENNVFIAHDPFAKDLVLNQVFYLYDRSNGHVIKSQNSGKTWFKTNSNLPVDTNSFTKSSLQAAPENAGHLWFNHPENGLYYSDNQGDIWVKLPNVAKAKVMTIGKAQTPTEYPAIYFIGTLTGEDEEALYRSTDKGQNWVKVTDENAQFILSSPRYMAADRNEFGKIYVGVSGLGVWQGQIQNQGGTLGFATTQAPLNKVFVYPNPASNRLFINDGTAGVDQWTIFDMTGKQLKTGSNVVKEEIDMSNFASGTYILVMQTNAGTIEKYILKQ